MVILEKLILETKNLTKKYKEEAVVNAVNLKVKEGSIYGFLGPNGAGKTTAIRLILGLTRSDQGEVYIFEKDFHKHRSEILSKIGSLIESPSYYPHLTGGENLEVFRRIWGIADKKRVDEVLEIVKLTQAKNKKAKNYSLGMKQRLGIALALLHQPQFLILDEPTNGLDPSGIHEIRELVKEMPKQFGITVMLSSHLLSEIEQVATDVGIIREGNLIYQDSLKELQKQAKPQIVLSVDQTERAKNVLADTPFEYFADENEIFILNPESHAVGLITKTLVEKEITIHRIEERGGSLEQIFLDMVGSDAS
ncbi:ABC transporter ATP-binding protein [Hazenella sp. IB182357]|uniref:ABC transporter ATP-binding protein n=1 Tax=Polycladospora coralii TaxID=2771432 RepID=A0A926RU35_9BACL|nr:ABC transporter ATP-binding protein [Polycladospora coralii]MBD1372092.1 ABC transporter ATP-binding protein [Polycladospora coralii]